MPPDDGRPDSFGLRLARIMEHRKLKAKDLEGPSGLDRGTIQKLMNGQRESTSIEAGLRIAHFLRVDPYSLIPDNLQPALSPAQAAEGDVVPLDVYRQIKANADAIASSQADRQHQSARLAEVAQDVHSLTGLLLQVVEALGPRIEQQLGEQASSEARPQQSGRSKRGR